ncbi:MAG: hypothetical protein HRF49_05875 [bacterium]|jgi:hypothetical protein
MIAGGANLADGSSTQEGITEDGFTLIPRGGLDKESFSLSSEELGSGEVKVNVAADGARDLPYALFELIYDPAKFNPVSVDFGEFFGTEELLTAGITTVAGNVGLGVVPIHYDQKEPVSGSGTIVTVTFEKSPYREVSIGRVEAFLPRESDVQIEGLDVNDQVAAVPQDIVKLRWREVLVGDGDRSGEVGISDLTPIAINFLEVPSSTPESTIFDYDQSDEVGVSDITPIALNYLQTVTGYNVYYSLSDDKSNPTLDGSVDRATADPGASLNAEGFGTYVYDIQNFAPEGESYWFFVRGVDGEGESPAESSAIEVPGGGGTQNPPLLLGFTVTIDNPLLPDTITAHLNPDGDLLDANGDPLGNLDFIANETYDFNLVSGDVSVYDPEQSQYLPPAEMFPSDPLWRAVWNNVTWTSVVTSGHPDAPLQDFPFSVSPGPSTSATAGADDPFTVEVSANIGGPGGETMNLTINVGADPNAPYLADVTPTEVDFIDYNTQLVRIFCNMNEGVGGTDNYTFTLIPALSFWPPDDPNPPTSPTEVSLVEGVDEFDLDLGEFVVVDQPNAEFGTEQVIVFKVPASVGWGAWRFRAGNTLGHLSSINHPPVDGTAPTDLHLVTTNLGVTPIPLRIYPVVVDSEGNQGVHRIVVFPENPRVQKYPNIVDQQLDASRYNQTWVREEFDSEGNKCGYFFPWIGDPLDPEAPPPEPHARIYTEDPFTGPGGSFVHNQAAWVATTQLAEQQDNPGLIFCTDWSARTWNRLVIDTTQLPVDTYYIAVFAAGGGGFPVGGATFVKQANPAPPSGDPPVIHAIADADIVFDHDRDNVKDSPWPFIEYPDAFGVTFDWAQKQDPALFIVADFIQPDVEFDSTTLDYHDTSVQLFNEEGGLPGNPVQRILGGLNYSPSPNAGISTFKPYAITSGPHMDPGDLPGIGEPGAQFTENDSGWIVFPLTEINPFILDNGRWYVGVAIWNYGVTPQSWVPNPAAPFAIPFSVANYSAG